MSDFARRPVGDLLRGPLLHAREGWLVLAATAVNLAAAVGYGWLGRQPPAGRDAEEAVTVCRLWPVLVFVTWVRCCEPDFGSTIGRTAQVATWAFA